MNVLVEQLREVADSIEPEQSFVAEMLRGIADRRSATVVDEHPNAKLALVIADALNDGQRRHDLLSEHEDHVLLLEVAEAARGQVDAELKLRLPQVPREWAKSAEVPDGVQFTPASSDQGSWVRSPNCTYWFIAPKFGASAEDSVPGDFDDFEADATSRGWSEREVNRYAPFVEVLS